MASERLGLNGGGGMGDSAFHGVEHLESIMRSLGGGAGRMGERSGAGPGDFLSMLIDSIENGPRRHGHPASPRGDSPFGGGILEDIFESIISSPGGGRGLSMADDLEGLLTDDSVDDDELNERFGPGKFRITAIGPDGIHEVGTGTTSASDVRALMNGRDVPGISDMVRNFLANPPTKGQSRLSMLRMVADGMPLAMQLHAFVGHAGAEIARFILKPDGAHDFAFMSHVSEILAKARNEDKETFDNVLNRLTAHKFDLVGLMRKIDFFLEKRTVSAASSVQMRLALLGSLGLALMDDVADALKEQKAAALEQLRRTSKI